MKPVKINRKEFILLLLAAPFAFLKAVKKPGIITKTKIVPRKRKLNAKWKLETKQDLIALHGLDAEQELSNFIEQELSNFI